MMSPVIFYTLILGVVEVLQYFLVPLVLKNGTGEPGGTTLFYNLYLYKKFFTYQHMSYGATLAWVLFVITLVDHAGPVRARPGAGSTTRASGERPPGRRRPLGASGRPASRAAAIGGATARRKDPARRS